MNLDKIYAADGLTDDESALVKRLVRVLKENEEKHVTRRAFYDDKIPCPDRGMDVPPAYKNASYSTGWARAAVDRLAERSIFDSYTFSGEAPDGFEYAMQMNSIANLYQMAAPAAIRDGIGFWNVTADKNMGAAVNYNDAMTAAAIYDFLHKRIRAGIVIEDFSTFGSPRIEIPSLAVVKTADEDIIIRRVERNRWEVSDRNKHELGYPMLVPMTYRFAVDRPFGQSRITRSVMTYSIEAMCELRNMAIQSDFFSIPMKYILGASDAQYKAISENVMKAYRTDLLAMTSNDDGQIPHVGMLQAASMEPHIAALDKLASMMASETSLPVATFGVAGNGYTSSDALRASTDDLVILAKQFNSKASESMEMVARLVMCVLRDCTLAELTDNERTVTAHFLDPSMPSDAQNADAMLKVCSVAPEFAGTDVFWEKLGYNEDDRRRIKDAAGTERAADVVKAFLTSGE